MQISASPLEITDAQNPLARGRVVPEADARGKTGGGNLRPEAAVQESASNTHAFLVLPENRVNYS
jgi:hypothetical protein